MKFFQKQGFTLIELIIVIAVIALLAASVFVAVDPAKRIGEAQDAQRWADITAIADAIQQYVVDNNGDFPTSTATFLSGASYSIMIDGASAYTSAACVASSTSAAQGILLDALTDTYLATMPVDPEGLLGGKGTGYYFTRTAAGRVRIGACVESPYADASIYVQR
jgi:prepilin-type N-terminal cleavage/methylation domain-containing protein